MKHYRSFAISLIFITLLACGGGIIGGDSEVEEYEQALTGRNVLLSWREGEVNLGRYFFEEVLFCSSGEYALYGQSERTTILDNVERNQWQHNGQWEVTRSQGQVGIQYLPASGNRYFFPLQGVSIEQRGQAGC